MAEEMQTYGQTNESVVIYRSADNAVRLDVQLAEETVWLSQKQMAQLFDTTPQNITLHIGNVYKEQELTQSDKFNSQYGNLSLHQTNRVHDRFMIIDNQTIYLIGASLKDAGKRLFAFTKMSATHIEELKKLL